MTSPLVSVVTPVFNTEKYLAECVESVLNQTYSHWEYVIVNNRSTDASGDIATEFSRRDPRIRVLENETFLSQMQNWNHAKRQISPDSRYCKVVHADDWLFPECIEEMVAAGETHPTAGLVGSYRLDETTVNLDGLPWPSPLISGRDICRWNLLEGGYVFGSPSSLLIRSEIVRARDPFYNETSIHADKAVCFDILKDWDFAFVHKILTFTRRHNESTTTFIRRFETYISGRLEVLTTHGPHFLTPEEYRRELRRLVNGYHGFFARSLLDGRDREFLDYHRAALKRAGIRLRPWRLLKSLLSESLNLTDNWRSFRRRRRGAGGREPVFDRSFETTIIRSGNR